MPNWDWFLTHDLTFGKISMFSSRLSVAHERGGGQFGLPLLQLIPWRVTGKQFAVALRLVWRWNCSLESPPLFPSA